MKRVVKRLLCVAVTLVLFCGNAQSVNAAGLKDIFDAEYYAEQYPDLKAAFGNNEKALYQHFLKFGIKEGRVMNPIIDIVKYREKYGDLQTAFGNNWDSYVNHYFTFGVNEHRENGTDFDLLAYLEAYGDVKAAYGNNYAAVAKHYAEIGMAEGREEGSKEFIEAREAEEEAEAEEAETEDTSKEEVSEDKSGTYKEYKEDGSYFIKELNKYGNLVKSTYYKGDGTVVNEMEYTYNSESDSIPASAKRVTASTGDVTIIEYDEKGNDIKSTFNDKDGNLYSVYENTFDENDKKVSAKRTNPDGTWWIMEYDENEEMIKKIVYNADGSVASTWEK